ncbi:MAG: hypothetical protein ACRCS3_11245, partial [Paracoccaceae bacterium]
MRFLLVVVLVLATPLWAENAPQPSLTVDEQAIQRLTDDARAMIDAVDIAGFDQAIRAGHAADLAAKGDQNRQRALYAAFVSADPRVAAFTAQWLAAEPHSPYAQMARVWHLHALGWAVRGTDIRRYTYPQALADMDKLHDAGLALAMQAREAAPDFVAASDAVILLGQTRGMADSAEAELARIMAIAPNLGSLTRASDALVPKWGGSTEAMYRICEDHAAKVPDMPGYTVAMCAIDIPLATRLSADVVATVGTALDQLPDHPHLVPLRARLAVYGHGSVTDRIAALEAFLPTADFNNGLLLEAAHALDRLYTQNTDIVSGHYETVRQGYIPWLTAQLDVNLADPGLLKEYIGMVGGPPHAETPSDEVINAVLRRALVAAPYNANVLHELVGLQIDRITPETLQAASPTIANALVYSNYRTKFLSDFAHYYHYAYRHSADSPVKHAPGTQSPEALAAFDTAVSCPYTRIMRILTYICETQGGQDEGCPSPESSADFFNPPLVA